MATSLPERVILKSAAHAYFSGNSRISAVSFCAFLRSTSRTASRTSST